MNNPASQKFEYGQLVKYRGLMFVISCPFYTRTQWFYDVYDYPGFTSLVTFKQKELSPLF